MKNKYIITVVSLLFLSCLGVQNSLMAQSTSENFIKTTTYKIPTLNSINNPSPTQAKVSVTYYDGLGRLKQQIAYKQSGTGKDIVTHLEYDALGRQTKEFLPYADETTSFNYRSSAATDVFEFYDDPYYENTTNPYSETFFEPSPLNRTQKIGAPGNIWKGNESNDNDKTIKFEYKTNNTGEVKRFTATTGAPVDNTFEPTFLHQGNYAANELYVTITKDENWTSGLLHTTKEYKDKLGRVILKRTYGISQTRTNDPNSITPHDTYYVYDIYGNLTYVLPPLIDKNNVTTATLNGLGYQYIYDHRNRLVEKKLPGKEWEYIVYDKLDRPVATGPAYSPFSNVTDEGWLITKYDRLNRPIITGWMPATSFSSTARKNLQNTVDNQTIFSEQKTTTDNNINGTPVRYSNNVQPTNIFVLTINYFDDYNFTNAPSLPSQVEGQLVHYNNTDNKPIGLPTATWEKVLPTNSSSSASNEFTYYIYDKYANPIRTHTKNFFNGRTEVDSEYDFSGKINFTLTRHKKNNNDTDLEIKDMFAYTAQDRLFAHTQQINQGSSQRISRNHYDDMGQLIKKDVGNNINTNAQEAPPLQIVDYSYNIRGWLTGINNINGLQQQNAPLDLFAFKINYTNTLQNYSGEVTPLYNGNISETLWRSGSDNVMRSYGYGYDSMNRLTNAIYGKPNSTPKLTHNYNEWLSYDANGNILSLGRNGINDTNYLIMIDNLTYTYKDDFSNKLIAVDDLSNNEAGFKKGNNDPNQDDYVYDDMGNLTMDNNKEITDITYNHLNLPVIVTFDGTNKNIRYLYTATGQKVQKKVQHQDSTSFTMYIHGFQYYDQVLQFFHTPEGYVKNTPTDTGEMSFDYIYQYKDHLGNVRVNYALDPDTGLLAILEESHYYPFGLQHSHYNSDLYKIDLKEEQSSGGGTSNGDAKSVQDDVKPHIPIANPGYMYKYNGKEFQDELGLNLYDYGGRNYMPDLGRYFNMDKFSEAYVDINPYQYTANNPVKFIDVNGDYIYIWDEKTRYKYENGETQKRNEETGEWETHQAEEGSYLSQVLGFLGDIAGGDENSFGSQFLRLFENDNINVYLKQNTFKDDNKGKNITAGKIIYTDFNQDERIRTTGATESISQNYHTTLFHELGHGFANNVFSQGVLKATWINPDPSIGLDKPISNSEVFGSMVENMLRAEQGLNLRTHYIGGSSDNRSRLIQKSRTKNPFSTVYNPTEATMAIYKTILQRPIQKPISSLKPIGIQ